MPEPTIEVMPAQTVAYIVMQGSFDQIPEGYDRLYRWIAQKGIPPTGMPQAVYLTDPATAPPEQWLFELWAPIGNAAEDQPPNEGGIGIKRIDAMDVAMLVHVGPYDAIAPMYQILAEWVAAHDYVTVGPPMEAYLSDPEETPADRAVTQIRFPVARRQ